MKKRRLKPGIYKSMMVLLLLCVLCAAAFLGYSLLRVKNFDIQGNTLITDREIVHASGVAFDTSFFDLDYDGIQKGLSTIPSLEVVSVEYKWPSTLQIVVFERVPAAVVKAAGGYAVIDREGVVLAIEAEPDDSLLAVHGVIVTGYSLGNPIGIQDEYQLVVLRDIIDALDRTGMTSLYSGIDVTNAVDINLRERHGIIVHIGQLKQIEDKLFQAEAIIKIKVAEGKTGLLDCTVVGRAAFKETDVQNGSGYPEDDENNAG